MSWITTLCNDVQVPYLLVVGCDIGALSFESKWSLTSVKLVKHVSLKWSGKCPNTTDSAINVVVNWTACYTLRPFWVPYLVLCCDWSLVREVWRCGVFIKVVDVVLNTLNYSHLILKTAVNEDQIELICLISVSLWSIVSSNDSSDYHILGLSVSIIVIWVDGQDTS